ncbi:SDR family oxidoreductase [Arcanobacterium buesumense]|uniref:SDR family oxidoreductase n=1 Tax=Arcanobacterium buesumense TaxID=2722751 RepID=A0A6H2EIU8_9ACTO|nr:SDR family oxidoreductase [Arcanobacterium buesumense]QJC21488.1 SDR family oxidoreductase [Arcanobacterium buesumense]
MGVYVVTGSASGMGRSTAEQLRWEGHRVIGVDLHKADVKADLSSPEGRAHAVTEVKKLANGRLDGAVLAAGLGPIPGREELIAKVNYLGVVELLEGLHEELAEAGNAKVVIFSSNSTTTVPGVPDGVVAAFRERDIDKALEIAAQAGPEASPNFIYAGSKTAITYWMRTIGVTEEWAGRGIRINALAPGAIRTPMLSAQLADPKLAPAIKSYPIPVRDFGKPEEVAQWAIFMLSPAANFLCGSVIFLDGGTDAYFRADSWPRSIPASDIPEYRAKMEKFAASTSE